MVMPRALAVLRLSTRIVPEGLFNRHGGGLGTAQNAIYVDGRLPEHSSECGSIREQAPKSSALRSSRRFR
jgi:hypothetical protein